MEDASVPGNHSIGSKPAEKISAPEASAPGWRIRCMRCDGIQPWDKFGIRPKTTGPEFTVIHCPQCKRVRTHIIEKVPPAGI